MWIVKLFWDRSLGGRHVMGAKTRNRGGLIVDRYKFAGVRTRRRINKQHTYIIITRTGPGECREVLAGNSDTDRLWKKLANINILTRGTKLPWIRQNYFQLSFKCGFYLLFDCSFSTLKQRHFFPITLTELQLPTAKAHLKMKNFVRYQVLDIWN